MKRILLAMVLGAIASICAIGLVVCSGDPDGDNPPVTPPTQSMKDLDVELELTGNFYTVTDLSSKGKEKNDIVIPESFNGVPVKRIERGAFGGVHFAPLWGEDFYVPMSRREYPNVRSVTIPKSIVSMGDSAFGDCESLTKVNYLGTIDQWVQITFEQFDTSIGDVLGSRANPLQWGADLYINGKKQVDVTINNSYVSRRAFVGCSSLVKVTFTENVKVLNEYAFWGCNNLAYIEFSNSEMVVHGSFYMSFGVREIINNTDKALTENDLYMEWGFYRWFPAILTDKSQSKFFEQDDFIFYGDSEISLMGYKGADSAITLPKDVNGQDYQIPEAIMSLYGGYSITGNNLTSITVEEGNANYTSQSGILYNKDKSEIIAIPSDIAGEIVLPNTISFIQEGDGNYIDTFSKYISLERIKIEEGCANFVSEDGIVYNADKTEFVSIPRGISGEVILPSTVEVAEYTFENCAKLTSICVKQDNPYYTSQNGILYNIDKTEIVAVPKGLSGEISLASNLTSVGVQFENNFNVTSIIIPDGVSEIYDEAFKGCNNLQNVTIPASVMVIGERIFADCENLKTVNYLGTAEQWKALNFYQDIFCQPFYTGTTLYINNQKINYADLTKNESQEIIVVIPDGTTTLTSDLINNENLTTLVIPASVTASRIVGKDYKNLTKINYLGTIDRWATIDFGSGELKFGEDGGYYEFYTLLSGGAGLYVDNKLVTSASINSDKITHVAFYNYDYLESATIGSNVKSIGCNAFGDCYNLKTVTIYAGVETMDEAFINCYFTEKLNYIGTPTQWAQINFVSSVRDWDYTSIFVSGADLYFNGKIAKDITINAKTVNPYAFYYCNSLIKVTLGEGVEMVGSRAFAYCAGLEILKVSESVKEFGRQAFSRCMLLKKVDYSGTVDQWVQILFDSERYSHPLGCGADFYINGQKQVEITINAETIKSHVFEFCNSIGKVTFGENVKTIEDGAFLSCSNLYSVVFVDPTGWTYHDVNRNGELDVFDVYDFYEKTKQPAQE